MLGPAPAVYDPGGLVFQADQIGSHSDPGAIARGAEALGAVLAVIPTARGTALSGTLSQEGWTIASDWYIGWPRKQGPLDC